MALSKSKFVRGVQCPKMLWMDKYMPDEAEDTDNESIFRTGNEVGDLAMGYFGDFTEVPFDKDNLQGMAEKTKELLEQGVPVITEATFTYNGNFCSVDILKNDGNGKFDIVEVKSSAHRKDIYVWDAAYQYMVLKKCGIDVGKVYIMYINSEYVRKGSLDLQKLFTREDITTEAVGKYSAVTELVEQLNSTLECQDEPDDGISVNCKNPYDCPYWNYCTRNIPVPNVFAIRNFNLDKKLNLYYNDIVTLKDAMKPDNVSLAKFNKKQLLQLDFEVNNKPPYIDKAEIKTFLGTLSYPVYYLDFETFQQAIPQYDGMSPYEQIPFQYSLHVKRGPHDKPGHYEFLAEAGTDPRRALAEQLIKDIPQNVCVLAYNMTFEKRVIKKLADTYPDISAQLMGIYNNIADLMVPFQKGYYYCKEMQGSYSIKYVLPALFPNDPELDYHNLNGVHNGSEASGCFAEMADHTPEEIEEMRANLLKYCGLDTYAMVKLHEKLEEVSQ